MGFVCASDRKSENDKAYSQEIEAAVKETVLSKYSIKKQILGKGHYGTVRKAVCRTTGKQFAIKKTSKHKLKLSLADILRENKVLPTIHHPNIIKYYETLEDEKYFYEVMELATGSSLIGHQGEHDEVKVSRIMRSALSAVSYLHSKGIIHRDLKPNNFMFASEDPNADVKLIDFGFARLVEQDEMLETRLGTPYYLAPELIEKNYDFRSDYWSLGVMMHVLLVGKHPFEGGNISELLKAIRNEELDITGPEWDSISSEAKDLLKKLLTKNPYKRITAHEALEHPWIKMSENSTCADEKNHKIRREIPEALSTETLSDLDKGDAKIQLNLGNGSVRGTWMSESEPSTGTAVETRGKGLDNTLLDFCISNQNSDH